MREITVEGAGEVKGKEEGGRGKRAKGEQNWESSFDCVSVIKRRHPPPHTQTHTHTHIRHCASCDTPYSCPYAPLVILVAYTQSQKRLGPSNFSHNNNTDSPARKIKPFFAHCVCECVGSTVAGICVCALRTCVCV